MFPNVAFSSFLAVMRAGHRKWSTFILLALVQECLFASKMLNENETEWNFMELFLLGLVIGIAATVSRYSDKEKKTRERAAKAAYWNVGDYDNQARFINAVNLYRVKPINKEAYFKVFRPLSEFLNKGGYSYNLWPEVGLGAFIRTPFEDREKASTKRAFRSFNSKRADFLITDYFGEPVLVIEYHGSGHYLDKDAEKRDKVKRLALKKAGVALIEVKKNTPDDIFFREVARVLSK